MAELVRITGLEELERRLRALPKEISGKKGGPLLVALRRAARAAQREAARLVRVDAAHDDGVHVRDNIIVARDRDPAQYGMTEVVHVTVRGRSRTYRDNKGNRRKGRVGQQYHHLGSLAYARYLEHGTSKMPAYPFLRPAFEATKGQMPELVKKELSDAIYRAVRKLNRGGR